MIIFIVSFIVTNNIYAQSQIDDLLSNKSLIHVLLNTYEDDIVVEEGLLTASNVYHAQAAQVEAPLLVAANDPKETLRELTTANTMAGGNTLIKPNISSNNPLSNQTLRDQIEMYEVADGDTLSSIAELFGISINTILWENKLSSRNFIKPGQKLTILPTSGISHVVKKNENINKIAGNYNIEAERILQFNLLDDDALLQVGQQIIIPEGAPKKVATRKSTTPTNNQPITTTKSAPVPPSAASKAANTSGMFWPTNGRVITQYWNWRHAGLDLDGETGDPIYSLDDGVIEVSAWNNGGYGFQVVVNHQNGIKTRYAHCSKLLHEPGDTVAKGDVVCLMGNTGRSTGSHLHLEVIINGVRQNPLNYIK